MPVPLPICCYWEECGTTRQYRVDPCSEGVAITIASVQLNWIWPNLGGQIYGFLRKYHLLPQLWLLVRKTLKCSRIFWENFSENPAASLRRMPSQNLGGPAWVTGAICCLSTWTTWPARPVGGSFLCGNRVYSWHADAFLLHPHHSSLPRVPFFILSSCSHIWVFPSFIFYTDPATAPSHH